jgi:hypothetical protein
MSQVSGTSGAIAVSRPRDVAFELASFEETAAEGLAWRLDLDPGAAPDVFVRRCSSTRRRPEAQPISWHGQMPWGTPGHTPLVPSGHERTVGEKRPPRLATGARQSERSAGHGMQEVRLRYPSAPHPRTRRSKACGFVGGRLGMEALGPRAAHGGIAGPGLTAHHVAHDPEERVRLLGGPQVEHHLGVPGAAGVEQVHVGVQDRPVEELVKSAAEQTPQGLVTNSVVLPVAIMVRRSPCRALAVFRAWWVRPYC